MNGSLFFAAAVLAMSAAGQNSSETLVFRIGTFDRSSQEFSRATVNKPVIFIAEKSRDRQWYATAPAAPQAMAFKTPSNPNAAPRSIRFQVAAPAASYHLRVALLIEGSSVPALGISINGKDGMFYPHPALDHSMGDQANGANPAYSCAEINFTFPGTYLKPGANVVALQAVEESDRPIPDPIGLTYDAIELTSSPEPFDPQATSADVLPTIFYQRKEGKLNELVDVFIHHAKRLDAPGSVSIDIHGSRYQQPLGGDHDFGEERIEFAVAEFPAHSRLKVAWSAGGRSHQREETIDPQKKWTLFLVPHIHLDIGYSDYQSKVAALQARVIDEAMDLTAQHPDFRFSIDGEWCLEQFLKTRTPAEKQRVIAAIRNRTLFVPAQYAIMLTGFPTAETLIRSLYPSANLHRDFGTPFNYANITDVPSYSWSYASVLSSAGIDYFLAGSHNDRAPVLMQGHLDEESPFWWVGPDGKKVLTWYSHCYLQAQLLFGLPAQMAAAHDMLPLFLQRYRRPTYRANAAILFGTQVENTDLYPQEAEFAPQWNRMYAYPRIQYSGFHEGLQNIAQQFGNDIPEVSGDGGPYWEEGIAADARYAAMERENERRGPSAEKLATLSSLINPRIAPEKTTIARMWTNMLLMGEHTWTSFNSGSDPTSNQSIEQQRVKDQYAIEGRQLSDRIMRLSLANIADSIPAGRERYIVFNPLNWARSGPVALDLSHGDGIVDASTGEIVPVEIISEENKAFSRVRFVARDVPALGYKVFLIRTSAAPAQTPEKLETPVLENPYYRVELDPSSGAVRSIYDKQLQKELVNQQSPYRFGQYLYVTGADERPNSMLQYGLGAPPPKLDIHRSSGGRLVSVVRTAYGMAARMESRDLNTPSIAAEVRLFNGEKKIEFVEDVEKNLVYTKEAVYFAFPFGLENAHFEYEIQNGVVNPLKDMYPGAGHEWFSVQHWVAAQQNGCAAAVLPLDAGLATLGDIVRGTWPAEFGSRTGTIFSFVMNNYWVTNWAAGQDGHFRFRYVVTSSSSIDRSALSRLGWQESTPFESGHVSNGVIAMHRNPLNHPEQNKPFTVAQPLDGKAESFLDVSDPNLVLSALKSAEDGNGTILRFIDFGGTIRTVSVKTPLLHLTGASETNAVELGEKPLSLIGDNGFTFTIHPHEIVTIRMTGTPRLKSPVI